jgi:hypothetical protein
MSRDRVSILADLSLADIKKLLANKKRIDTLAARKTKLARELTKVESDLARLLAAVGLTGGKAPRRKVRKKAKRAKKKTTKKKTTKKRAAKKRTTKKKVTRKKVAKKATKKKATKKRATRKKVVKKTAAKKKTTKRKTTKKTRRKTAKKATRKPARRKASRSGNTLEDVVAGLIKKNGGPLPFQKIYATITRRKLFVSKSKNFDNVLRRTLSTSRKVKRVGRGVYALA